MNSSKYRVCEEKIMNNSHGEWTSSIPACIKLSSETINASSSILFEQSNKNDVQVVSGNEAVKTEYLLWFELEWWEFNRIFLTQPTAEVEDKAEGEEGEEEEVGGSLLIVKGLKILEHLDMITLVCLGNEFFKTESKVWTLSALDSPHITMKVGMDCMLCNTCQMT